MLNLSQARFEAVVTEAKAKCEGLARCERAIDKAVARIETNPYMDYRDGELLVLGTTGETYRANGVCQCKAYAASQLCWHRTLAKLLKRYHEAEQRPVVAAPEITQRGGRVYASASEV